MVTAPTLKSKDWTMDIEESGTLVQGLDDIRQCVMIIMRTAKGSDPLRPEFGTNIYKLVDAPISVAAPQITAEIIDGITTWEPRVVLKSVKYKIEDSHLIFNIELIVNVATGEVLTLSKVRFT